MNILDGTVLLDGAPPSRLPFDMLQHPLYLRTFGSSNFEVAVTRAGVRQTLRPIHGCFYDFYWSTPTAAGGVCAGPKQLVIEEVEQDSGQRLQLLDPGEDNGCGQWGGQLPVRLRLLHSHWLSRWVGGQSTLPVGLPQLTFVASRAALFVLLTDEASSLQLLCIKFGYLLPGGWYALGPIITCCQ